MNSSENALLRTVLFMDFIPSDRMLWGTLAVFAAIIPLWESCVSVTILGFPQVTMLVGGMLLLRWGYATLRPNAYVIQTLLETVAGLLAYTAILATISYLCARNTMPLFDHYFRMMDEMLGYDWQAWADYEHSGPILNLVLKLAYDSLIPQTILILTFLPLVKGGRRGFTFIRASLIGAIISCAGSYFLPVAMPEAIHADWFPDWAALRAAGPFSTSLPQIKGIISFPSFHAALAIIMFYSVRGLGPVTWFFGALELCMLIATPTYGHHYFCDVLAGIAVAIFAIWLTERLNHLVPPARTSAIVS